MKSQKETYKLNYLRKGIAGFLVLFVVGCGQKVLTPSTNVTQDPVDNSGVPSDVPTQNSQVDVAASANGSEFDEFSDMPGYLAALDENLNENSEQFISTKNINQEVKNDRSWKPAALLLDFALSEQHRLGPSIEKGIATAIVIFRHPDPKATKSLTTSEILEEDVPSLEEISAAVGATGKVKDMDRFNQELAGIDLVLSEMSQAVNTDQKVGWMVGRVRLDLAVDVSGRIRMVQGPQLDVGGEVRFRMDWAVNRKPVQPLNGSIVAYRRPELVLAFQKLTASLARDLTVASADFENHHRSFKTQGFRIGFGMIGKVNLGLVKAGASAIGHLIFVPKPISSMGLKSDLGQDFALESYLVSDSVVVSKKSHESVSAERFQRGLKKAFRVARFFGDMAERRDRKKKIRKWQIRDIKVGFDMSDTGDLVLVTEGGLISTEVTLSR